MVILPLKEQKIHKINWIFADIEICDNGRNFEFIFLRQSLFYGYYRHSWGSNSQQNINLIIPRDKLIVITGLSGSGKSSLAFDTLYAEGQRRYVESLSAYARQFLSFDGKAGCGFD